MATTLATQKGASTNHRACYERCVLTGGGRRVPWVPEVFSRVQCDQFSAQGRTTSGEGQK